MERAKQDHAEEPAEAVAGVNKAWFVFAVVVSLGVGMGGGGCLCGMVTELERSQGAYRDEQAPWASEVRSGRRRRV